MAEYITYDQKFNEIERKSYNFCETCGLEVKRCDCLWDTFTYNHSGRIYSVNLFYCNALCKERRTQHEKDLRR